MTRRSKFRTPTGIHDILPKDQKYYRKIYSVIEEIADFYGFKKIDTPILEETSLFERGIGLATDIVQKQMFSFRTRGGDHLTLRPEGTAPVARAFVQHGMHNLPQPVKVWYFGPFFRHERPQAGRYRQFYQFGFEVLGEQSPVIDAQVVLIFFNILKNLKFKDLIIGINSIGDSSCRPYYKKVLASYFRSRESALCADCRRRLKQNPLRILDCKEEKCQPVISMAPQILDHLCDECHSHFKEVLEFLDELELPYQLNPYLARGLDYYTKTVFEIFENTEEGKRQGTLIGGGRYDNLVKALRGNDTPACGGAAGIERIISSIKTKAMGFRKISESEVFLAQLGPLAKRKSLKLLEEFREKKIKVGELLGKDSLKAQLNRANKFGTKYTLIFGQQEALEEKIIIRNMKTGKQEIIPVKKLVSKLKKLLK